MTLPAIEHPHTGHRGPGLAGRRHLPGGAPDPDAHRDLGPYLAHRAGGELVRQYQATYDFRVLAVATASGAEADGTEIPGIAFDQAMFDYAWHGAMLYGHEAFGWGERRFSGSGADQDRAEYHRRPSPTPGYFTGGINGPTTEGAYERPTDKGKVTFNPTAHTARFG